MLTVTVSRAHSVLSSILTLPTVSHIGSFTHATATPAVAVAAAAAAGDDDPDRVAAESAAAARGVDGRAVANVAIALCGSTVAVPGADTRIGHAASSVHVASKTVMIFPLRFYFFGPRVDSDAARTALSFHHNLYNSVLFLFTSMFFFLWPLL